MYVCIYVYVNVYMYICIYIHIHTQFTLCSLHNTLRFFTNSRIWKNISDIKMNRIIKE